MKMAKAQTTALKQRRAEKALKKWREGGRNPNAEYSCGTPLIVWAAEAWCEDDLKELIEAGADVNAKAEAYGRKGCTALHAAAKAGKARSCAVLLDAGADTDAKLENGDAPLHNAAEAGNLEVVEMLLAAGAKPYENGFWSRTPLYVALAAGRADCAEALARGDDVWWGGLSDDDGRTLIHAAAEGAVPGMYRFLRDIGANPEGRDVESRTAAHVAASGSRGMARSLSGLIEIGVPAAAWCRKSRTPVHHAAERGSVSAVKVLLKAGAAPGFTDWDKNTPMHKAAEAGRAGVLRVLIKAGADPDARNAEGETPLHRAAVYGRTAACQVLIEAGADRVAKDSDGRTPMDRALSEGMGATAAWLDRAGYEGVGEPGKEGKRPRGP